MLKGFQYVQSREHQRFVPQLGYTYPFLGELTLNSLVMNSAFIISFNLLSNL